MSRYKQEPLTADRLMQLVNVERKQLLARYGEHGECIVLWQCGATLSIEVDGVEYISYYDVVDYAAVAYMFNWLVAGKHYDSAD